MWRHACHPRIVDIVASLLGTEDIKMYGDQLFMKAPETGTEQPWHQDSASLARHPPNGSGDGVDGPRRCDD